MNISHEVELIPPTTFGKSGGGLIRKRQEPAIYGALQKRTDSINCLLIKIKRGEGYDKKRDNYEDR